MSSHVEKAKSSRKTAVVIYANTALFLINGFAAFVCSSTAVLVFGLVIQAVVLPIACVLKEDQVKVMYASFVFGSAYIIVAYVGTINNNGGPYYTPTGSDDRYFENTAITIVQSGQSFLDLLNSNTLNLDSRYVLYSSILAIIIQFGNFVDCYSVFMFRQFNVLLLVFSSGLFWSILEMCPMGNISSKYTKIVSYCFAFCPSIWYIASFAFRDILCLFLILLFVFCLEKVAEERRYLYLLLGGVSLVLQLYVRSHACVAMLAVACVYLVVSVKTIGLRVVLVASIGALAVFVFVSDPSQFLDASERGISFAQAGDGESGITQIVVGAPLFPFGVFMRFFYGFALPNPSFSYLFAGYDLLYGSLLCLNGISTLSILACIPFAIKGVISPFDRYTITFLAFYSIFLLSMSFRQSILAYPFLFLLILRGKNMSPNLSISRTHYLYLVILVGAYVINSVARI